jgi:hypothetical protein
MPGTKFLILSFGKIALGNARRIASIALLGSDVQLAFEQQPDGLHVQLPGHAPSRYACAIRILIKQLGARGQGK